MHHEKRRAIAAESEHPLNLERVDALFGTAKEIPSNQPFSERDVRILENCSNRDRELLFALGTLPQPRADFGHRTRFDLPDACLICVFAMRANNAIRPADFLKICTRALIGCKARLNLIERKICWSWQHGLGFHATSLALS